MNPRNIQIADYNYALPDERIAKYPLADRASSKLLIYHPERPIEERHFADIPSLIPEGTLLVMNNTRVIRARLHFQKDTGATIEVFLLEPASPIDYQLNLSSTTSITWYCMIGNLKRWKEGRLSRTISIKGQSVTLSAERLDVHGTSHEVRFSWDAPEGTTYSFSEVLEAIGELPIPPYLNRKTEESDLNTYQTVYSKVKGSVAAPTAGLHFTPEVLAQLDANGVERNEVTLHVGAGTFRPVKSESIGEHEMHAEWISVSRKSIERLLAHEGHCFAVGTTSVRTLESLYYIGVILSEHPNATEEELSIPQWMPYESTTTLTAKDALQHIIKWMDAHHVDVLHTTTQIIIAPGYDYHIVEAIITNFHQPQSTLLLLVSAFVRGDWHRIYDHALAHDFRFLSYGDSSILFRS